jgi:hypothetical protein
MNKPSVHPPAPTAFELTSNPRYARAGKAAAPAQSAASTAAPRSRRWSPACADSESGRYCEGGRSAMHACTRKTMGAPMSATIGPLSSRLIMSERATMLGWLWSCFRSSEVPQWSAQTSRLTISTAFFCSRTCSTFSDSSPHIRCRCRGKSRSLPSRGSPLNWFAMRGCVHLMCRISGMRRRWCTCTCARSRGHLVESCS